MQTLLLASNRTYALEIIPNILKRPARELNFLTINTAATVEHYPAYQAKHRSRLAAAGYHYEEYDLAGRSPRDMHMHLLGRDVIFLSGGNTFYLMKCIRESGFGDVIREALAEGALLAGASAGAYVMCPSIEMATWKPDRNDRDRFGVTDFSGLGLVSFLVTAHYTPDLAPVLKPAIARATYPVRILADGQALLVRDREVTFMGTTPEVHLDPQ
ncbi:MAG: Type 1 glutamine amidotransferase-like domain-containing protein [Candidatus Kerfeldbacteria bacterium]|nr:Type 1 glutamine amidotransferase-like domain-containing protein [Candidatus Kerfeldbacteria bacterium]